MTNFRYFLIASILLIPTIIFAQSKDIFKDPASAKGKEVTNVEYKINELATPLPAYFILPAEQKSVGLKMSKPGGRLANLKLFNTVNGWLSDSGMVVSNGKNDVGLVIDFTSGKIYQMPKEDAPKYLSKFSFNDAIYLNEINYENEPDVYANVIVIDASGNYSKEELKSLSVINERTSPKLDRQITTPENVPSLDITGNKAMSRNQIIQNKPVITAAANGQLDRLIKLINSNADINEVDDVTGDNALIRAIRNGAEETVFLLIDRGINIKHKNRAGQSALHTASDMGYYEISKRLIEMGADIGARDNSGNTPIIYASLAPNAYLTELLVKSGASINDQNKQGDTPLSVAAVAGNTNTISVLINNGAKIDMRDKDGNDILMKAVYGANERTVKKLLELGMRPDNKNNSGITTLHVAMNIGNLEIIDQLIKAGADVNAKDFEGNTPLIKAVLTGNLKLVEGLLKYNPDLLAVNKSDKSAFNLAKESGFKKVEDLLSGNLEKFDTVTVTLFDLVLKNDIVGAELAINRGARVNSADISTGNTPLFTAIANNQRFMVTKLLELGANVNYANLKGNTPLLIATASSNNEIMSQLLKAGALPNLQNQNGDTALIWATKLKRPDKVRALLLVGGDPNLKNNDGVSAFNIAFNEGTEEILGLLQSAGGRK